MHLRSRRRLALRVLVLVTLVTGALGIGFALHRADVGRLPERARRLAEALAVRPGSTVAEIGAGSGLMVLEMARIVGPGGRVMATEMSEDQVEAIRRAGREAGLDHVTVLRAGERDSNLPPGCCDAVYMQRVFHHLTDPGAVVESVSRALRPGARIAILEFEPNWIANFTTPPGVPDRGGHGVPKTMLAREMKAYGFEPLGQFEKFDHGDYLAVFRPSPIQSRKRN